MPSTYHHSSSLTSQSWIEDLRQDRPPTSIGDLGESLEEYYSNLSNFSAQERANAAASLQKARLEGGPAIDIQIAIFGGGIGLACLFVLPSGRVLQGKPDDVLRRLPLALIDYWRIQWPAFFELLKYIASGGLLEQAVVAHLLKVDEKFRRNHVTPPKDGFGDSLSTMYNNAHSKLIRQLKMNGTLQIFAARQQPNSVSAARRILLRLPSASTSPALPVSPPLA